VKETLHSVIESLIDGEEGFQKIGEDLKDESLRHSFTAESLKHASFRAVNWRRCFAAKENPTPRKAAV
jgi:hypothetical protein